MIRQPPKSTLDRSSAASDVYKRQILKKLSQICSPRFPGYSKRFTSVSCKGEMNFQGSRENYFSGLTVLLKNLRSMKDKAWATGYSWQWPIKLFSINGGRDW